MGKHPWALTAQAPQTEGGQLHGLGAWMVQLSPCKSLPKMRSSCRIDLHLVTSLVLVKASPKIEEVVSWWKADRLVAWFSSLHLLLALCKFCVARKEQGYRRMGPKLWCQTLRCLEAHQNNRSYVHELKEHTFNSLRKNLAWWVVTLWTSKKPQT